MPLPDEKSFLKKFMSAVTAEEELMRAYFERFDAYYNSNFSERSRDNIVASLSFYGGYRAKKRLIESVPIEAHDIVLDIGPEMGVECLLLAEVYDKVFVAEPDARSCELIEQIAKHYVTDKGTNASEILDIKQAGIIPADATVLAISPEGKDTGIYAFDARGAKDIGEVLGRNFADRIICNHVVQVMPKEPKLRTLLENLASYLKAGGKITWTDSIPELSRIVGGYYGKSDGKLVTIDEIQDSISRLLPDFKVSFGLLEKPRQLLTVAEKV